MDTPTVTPARPVTAASRPGFDRLMAILSAWTVLGLYLDGWAHTAFANRLETFFTPWHAVLYSGVAAMGAALLALAVVQHRQGAPWRAALPRGYALSALGFALFVLAGVGDVTWHSAFGFEVGVEALLSPPHLALATGGVLLTGGPLWVAWLRPRAEVAHGWRALWPMLVALGMVLSVATFFTQYANALTNASLLAGLRPPQSRYVVDSSGMAGVIVPTGVLMTALLLAISRWTLPAGSLTCLMGVNALLMFTLNLSRNMPAWLVLPAAVLGGGVGRSPPRHPAPDRAARPRLAGVRLCPAVWGASALLHGPATGPWAAVASAHVARGAVGGGHRRPDAELGPGTAAEPTGLATPTRLARHGPLARGPTAQQTHRSPAPARASGW